MADYFDNWEDSDNIEVVTLVDRFENMIKNNQTIFFDVYEYGDIIDFYFDKGNKKQSYLALDYAIKLHPDSIPIILRMAMWYATNNESAKALSYIRRVENTEEDDPEITFTKASIYSQLKLYNRSIEEYKKLIDIWDDPGEILMNIAFEYENIGNYTKSIGYLRKAIEKDPGNDNLLYELGYCFEILNRTEESIRFFVQYIETNPYSDIAWFNLGIAYSNTGLYEKSIEANDYVIAINPEFTSAYFNKANALVDIEEYAKAIEVFKEVLELDNPPDSMTYYYIGECYEKLREWENSILYYNKALEIDEYIAEAWIGLGVVYEEKNNLAKALLFFRKAVEVEPINSEYWYLLGDLQLKMKLRNDALKSYHKVAELDSGDKEIWLDISELYFEDNQQIKACRMLQKGIHLQPKNASFQYRLAAYLYLTGQIKEARKQFEQALSMDNTRYKEFFSFSSELSLDQSFLDMAELYKSKH